MLGEVRATCCGTLLSLHGELDLMTVDALRAMLDDLFVTGERRVVVDLGDVSFVDVESLSVVLAGADRLREHDGGLQVTGASRAVRRMCRVLNAEDVLSASGSDTLEA